MKILLISPCKNVRFKTPKAEIMPQLALHILAGLTPAEHEIHIIKEETDAVDLNEECDLVGLSYMTANAPRAYSFAAEFRKRGKTVVLGVFTQLFCRGRLRSTQILLLLGRLKISGKSYSKIFGTVN